MRSECRTTAVLVQNNELNSVNIPTHFKEESVHFLEIFLSQSEIISRTMHSRGRIGKECMEM